MTTEIKKNGLANSGGFGKSKPMKKATTKTPVKDLKTEETIDHRKVVLLEDIQSKMEQVLEGMESTKETLQKEMGEFRKEVNERFEMVDFGFKKMQSDMGNLDIKIDGVEKRLDAKIDGVEKRLDSKFDGLDVKIDGVEKRLSDKLDKFGGCQADHEIRIVTLETVHL